MVAALAHYNGAAEVTSTDVLTGPLERAKSMGADKTIQITSEALPENYYDVVFECSASPIAVSSAFVAVRRAGTVIQVGILGAGPQPIAIAALVSKEITLKGAFRFNNEVEDAVKLLLQSDKFPLCITHILKPDDAVEAFEIAKNSQISGKVLIDFQ